MADLPLGIYLGLGLRRWVVGEVEGEMVERCARAIGDVAAMVACELGEARWHSSEGAAMADLPLYIYLGSD